MRDLRSEWRPAGRKGEEEEEEEEEGDQVRGFEWREIELRN